MDNITDSSSFNSVKQLFSKYQSWILKNPQSLDEIEAAVKWTSYILAGRYGHSNLLCEILYMASRLYEMFNDYLLRNKVPHLAKSQENRIKLLLSVLEGVEVVIEVGATQFYGEAGKWLVVALIQFIKTIWRLILLFREHVRIISTPAVLHFDRSEVFAPPQSVNGDGSIKLPYSGHVLKPLSRIPPPHLRTFRKEPPQGNLQDRDRPLPRSNKQLCAELIHVMRPITHLCGVGMFGQRSWIPTAIAFCMDASSWHLYRDVPLTAAERAVLTRRHRGILLYLLRSPMYQNVTRDRLRKILLACGSRMPFAGGVCGSLLQYISHWNNVYCHSWSN